MEIDGAEELYARFISEGIGLIKMTIEEGWGESQILDFKQAEGNEGPMSKSDQQQFGKALSGYSNADGGVIVWGIRADFQDRDEPDVAKELKPISKLQRFVCDLQALTGQLASPAVIGVLHHTIPESPDDPDKGYAVTYVPRSDGLPTMATGRDQHRYYVRAGASFIKMTASMVADRHLRRPQPKLEFFCRVDPSKTPAQFDISTSELSTCMVIGIRNIGRGIARFPALSIASNQRFKRYSFGIDGNGNTGFPRAVVEEAQDPPTLYVGGSERVIYPGTELAIDTILTKYNVLRPLGDLAIKYGIYCDGFTAEGVFVVSAEELTFGRKPI
jgi:hypothetical protein